MDIWLKYLFLEDSAIQNGDVAVTDFLDAFTLWY